MKSSQHTILRTVSILIGFVGGGGSLAFMLYAGRNNSSILLLALFAGWVLSPFVALLLASRYWNRLSLPNASAIYILICAISIGALVSYYKAFNSPSKTPAFIFLLVPFISWCVIMVTFIFGRRRK